MTKILYIVEGKYIELYTENFEKYTIIFELSTFSNRPVKKFLTTALIPYLNSRESYCNGTLATKNGLKYTGILTESDFEIIYD